MSKRKLTESEARDRADLISVLSTPQGRRFVRRVLAQAGHRMSTFHTNALVMSFNEGRREIGVWLEAEVIDAGEEHYIRLLKEPDNSEQGSVSEGEHDES